MGTGIYYVDKWIFRGATLLALVFWIAIMLQYGFNDKIYVTCPENMGMCHNPLYNNCGMLKGDDPSVVEAMYYCNQSYLLSGTTIGEPAPKILGSRGYFVVFLIYVFAFALNHLLYNRVSQLKLRRSKE